MLDVNTDIYKKKYHGINTTVFLDRYHGRALDLLWYMLKYHGIVW